MLARWSDPGRLWCVRDNRCMLDMALNSVRFFRNESCGKCVPCRVGSQKLVSILSGWTSGESKPGDMELCGGTVSRYAHDFHMRIRADRSRADNLCS